MRVVPINLAAFGGALLFILLGACENENRAPLVASNIVVPDTLPGMHMTAAYLTLTNNTSATMEITDVFSDQFDAVEIHESSLQNGISKMRRVSVLSIAAKSSVTLERGGKHLMLIGPTGNSATVSLSFFSGDTLLLSVDAPRRQRAD